MVRSILGVLASAVLAGVVVAVLGWAGYHAGWVAGVCVAAAVFLVITVESHMLPPRPPLAAPPNPDRLHWHYLQLALSTTLMAFALWRLQGDPLLVSGWLAFAAGTGLGLWGAARQRALALQMRVQPGVFDERARANQHRAERWALLAALEAGLILGFLDHEGIVNLSGASVGFTVAFVAVQTGLLGPALLEWRDSRGVTD